MRDIQYISTGDVMVAQGDIVLQSTPIGSCIVIMAWHPERVGGMAHVMLPGEAPKTEFCPTKYTINAVDEFRKAMGGTEFLKILGVCVVGGANVLRKPDDSICRDNILSVTTYLSKLDIPVRRSVLGGFERRTALLDAHSGLMQYSQGNSQPQNLWEPNDEFSSGSVSLM